MGMGMQGRTGMLATLDQVSTVVRINLYTLGTVDRRYLLYAIDRERVSRNPQLETREGGLRDRDGT
jgi:hypothetical protein